MYYSAYSLKKIDFITINCLILLFHLELCCSCMHLLFFVVLVIVLWLKCAIEICWIGIENICTCCHEMILKTSFILGR